MFLYDMFLYDSYFLVIFLLVIFLLVIFFYAAASIQDPSCPDTAASVLFPQFYGCRTTAPHAAARYPRRYPLAIVTIPLS